MAVVNSNYTSPLSATLDKSTGGFIDEVMCDAWSSNDLHCHGTAGYIAGGGHQAATQSVNDSAATVVLLGAEHMDADPNGAMHDNVTLNSRITARTTGVFLANAWLQWASNPTGYRHSSIRLNGATAIGQDVRAAVNGTTTELTPCRVYPLTAGDYVELVVIQTSGAALTLSQASLSLTKL